MTGPDLALSVCESPIEADVISAMFGLWEARGYNTWSSGLFKGRPVTLEFFEGDWDIRIALQAELSVIPKRRVDMVVMCDFCPAILVEHDGVKWHSNREAMVRDREKDRQALLIGMHTIRFAGPEVFRSAEDVALEIRQIASELDFRSWKSDYARLTK